VSWAVPALALALALVWSRVRLGWDLRRRQEVRDPALLVRFDRLRRAAGLRRPVRLTQADDLQGPITFGLLRPEVALPVRALDGLRPSHERAMLAHELAHVVRRDALWFAALAGLERVLCFQPLLRVARRRLVEVAEERADDQAVRWTGDRVGLAGCLAEIARWIVENRRARALPVAGMASSRLGHRIERLLVPDPPPEPRQRWFPAAALGLLVTTAGAAPSVRTITEADASPLPEPGSSPASAERPASSTPAARDSAPERSAVRVPVHVPVHVPVRGPVEDRVDAAKLDASLHTALRTEYALLEVELELLGAELEDLHAELATTSSPSTDSAVAGLSERLERLRRMHALARELVEDTLPPPED